MKKKLLSFFLMLSVSNGVFSYQSKELDLQTIKKFQGCYAVSYHFQEYEPIAEGYELRKPYNNHGTELIIMDEESENSLSFQHLLITPHGIVKHWRHQWDYESSYIYKFEPPMNFNYLEYPDQKYQGTWIQRVYQVDDSPRYECMAKWTHTLDQGSYWECESDNPLPRREYTTRNDYNILQRTNKHQINEASHIHYQDSIKINKVEVEEHMQRIPLVKEKGINTYKRIEMENCARAIEWWENNKAFWSDVKFVWNRISDEKKNILFKKMNHSEDLVHQIFDLNKKYQADDQFRGRTLHFDLFKTIFSYLE